VCRHYNCTVKLIQLSGKSEKGRRLLLRKQIQFGGRDFARFFNKRESPNTKKLEICKCCSYDE